MLWLWSFCRLTECCEMNANRCWESESTVLKCKAQSTLCVQNRFRPAVYSVHAPHSNNSPCSQVHTVNICMWTLFKDAGNEAVTVGQPVIDKTLQLLKCKINIYIYTYISGSDPTDIEEFRFSGMSRSRKVAPVEQ